MQQGRLTDCGCVTTFFLMADTPTRTVADLLLEEGIDQFITARRATGRSWRLIAQDLRDATGGRVNVTHETVRHWGADLTTQAA